MGQAQTRNQNVALWSAFREGNREAFKRIYDLHADELLCYGHQITTNVQLIEDSIHDLFVELWQSRAGLSDTDSIKFYLFRALRNKIFRVYKRDEFYRATDLENCQELEEQGNWREKQIIQNDGHEELMRQLRAGYRQLSPRQQQAIDLRFTHHFSNEEIAQIMGINYQSACKFIYSGLKVLRQVVRILSVVIILGYLF
ncbi:RNA polymerase sigma factor [Persicitalea jodogahamensis]|uniref:DNA-directed RNA polymerase sigma-70 factor n=1 Tax=Persicitalea jodogahamensis TaxID=402147 RepID=A0A8J3GB18_9BACT|nr:sigma-70 family RNA polymerase sigma factor [Persicitalea jodogahamensis]GHB78124.1 DNA-directed RNA polymerase sigma-70 factor [Persicitalea jodogahamensis]